jgi:hypothetical protein
VAGCAHVARFAAFDRRSMGTTQDVPCAFRYHGHADTPAVASVVLHPRSDRVRRAIRSWLGLWGLAIAAVFVPLLHFVLVPGLLLLGMVMGLLRLREHGTIVSVRGACPACGVPQAIEVGAPLRADVALRCEACGRPLWLHGADRSAPAS